MDPQSEPAAPSRGSVLEGARRVLADGQPRKAKEIAAALVAGGLAGVDKSLVNSVLAREGRGEFAYDRTAYTYSLGGPGAPTAAGATERPAMPAAPTTAAVGGTAVPRTVILGSICAVLRDGQPRQSREIVAELAKRGLAGIDKSVVNSVLSREGRGVVVYDRAAYTYTLAPDAPAPPDPG